MTSSFRSSTLTLIGTGLAIAAVLATPAARAASAQEVKAQKTAEIPVCSKNLGAIAVIEPENHWWSSYQLESPAALIKLFVNRSRCFTLLDRGKGLAAAQGERDLAASGELRGRSNIGKGQMRAADYVLVPDLINANSNAGGNAIGGLLGGLVGGNAGAVLGGINMKKKSADVLLTVTDVRSSEQLAMAEGHASKTDLGWGGAGSLWTGSHFGSAGASGYSNTEVGQVITLAYLQAYSDLVAELGGLPANASAANVQQAVSMTRPGRLFTNAQGKGVVRDLDPGMLLYPTGQKQGVMWEVEDELGNKGWVSSSLVELAR
ncbi:CsgG/HfaB family protein [Agrilutibacter solisilvae]|uniref:Peptidoglycan-binding protein n=1 Tax=Agrilutibacter solisilvae TaxID=2763317 RepID=A0A974XZP4_9GAMM|nr:CsgG/HfaB family protein [Lysobacter solisilvae]QSX78746.1 peptidoglycan-binding protein [Lysobacter solisilvae]